MTEDKIAKNLLEGKTCDECEWLDIEYTRNPLGCKIVGCQFGDKLTPLPPERTCEYYEAPLEELILQELGKKPHTIRV